jgi:small GTP-binding protein
MHRPIINQAALLTGPGAAALAVVRLRGPAVWEFAKSHLSRPPQIGRCIHAQLRSDSRIIDDPVVVAVDEQTLDLSLHGGEWVVRECLALAERSGFQIVENSADLLDADDPVLRDVLFDLPRAKTVEAVTLLLAQPGMWKSLANDPSQADLQSIKTDRSLRRLLDPPAIAIVGAANVGKSTLANQLFGQTRSIAADMPGTTRDYVSDFANLDGLPVHLLDTPGQRVTDDSIESAAIAQSASPIASADLVILVLDAARPFAGEQARLRERFRDALCVINKSDCPPAWDLATIPAAIRTVATAGDGIAALRQRVRERFVHSFEPRPLCWRDEQVDRLNALMRNQ